jgi:hypothetical protein
MAVLVVCGFSSLRFLHPWPRPRHAIEIRHGDEPLALVERVVVGREPRLPHKPPHRKLAHPQPAGRLSRGWPRARRLASNAQGHGLPGPKPQKGHSTMGARTFSKPQPARQLEARARARTLRVRVEVVSEARHYTPGQDTGAPLAGFLISHRDLPGPVERQNPRTLVTHCDPPLWPTPNMTKLTDSIVISIYYCVRSTHFACLTFRWTISTQDQRQNPAQGYKRHHE